MTARHAVSVCMAGLLVGACFATNPQFDVGETGDQCAEHFLDCDDEPGCETPANDPAHCGSCDKSCEVAGQLLTCEAGVCSGVASLPAIADTFINETQSDQNFEGEPLFEVDAEPDNLHAFIATPDLSVLPPDAEILGASLYLSCLDDGGTVELHRVASSWTAADLTWDSRPFYDDVAPLSFEPPAGPVEIDVSTFVDGWIGGEPDYGIALLPTDGNGSQYAALESDNGPRLLVDLRW